MYKLIACMCFLEAINIFLMIGQYLAIKNELNGVTDEIRTVKKKIKKNVRKWIKNGTD